MSKEYETVYLLSALVRITGTYLFRLWFIIVFFRRPILSGIATDLIGAHDIGIIPTIGNEPCTIEIVQFVRIPYFNELCGSNVSMSNGWVSLLVNVVKRGHRNGGLCCCHAGRVGGKGQSERVLCVCGVCTGPIHHPSVQTNTK